ncbi:MAG: flagellar hook-associated protein FlgL [Selenomonadaceae bacterium]|nr:flagellar hook-associated protein FlgL [Selenomonadaceae bacterium]
MSFRMSSVQFMTNYQASLNKTYQKQAKLLEQGDGSSIHRGSDDPIAYSKLLRYKVSANENDQYTKNVQNATAWMQTTDGALSHIAEITKTFKEKTIEAATSANNDSNFDAIAKEMWAMIEEVYATSKTQHDGRYVFGGQKDQTEPFTLSTDTQERANTKTLDDSQKDFFLSGYNSNTDSVYQFIELQDTSGETFYLDPYSQKLYKQDLVVEGYKDWMAQGIETVDGVTDDSVSAVTNTDSAVVKLSDYFTSEGTLKSGTDIELKVDGTNKTFTVQTSPQQMVKYHGDENYISMVKLNGATDTVADIVNAVGKDLFGTDVFDGAASGYGNASGSSMINCMLTVYNKVKEGDVKWLVSDGVTLADAANATVTTTQTTIGAKLQLYTSVEEMLANQSDNITEEITNVSGTDVAKMATDLMEMTTLYNMALSLGGRVLPQSLADYL